MKMEVQITANVTRFNRKQAAAAMGDITCLFAEFENCKTPEEIGNQVARINGYLRALVNLEILDTEQANGEIREAAVIAAAIQEGKIEGLENGCKKDIHKGK